MQKAFSGKGIKRAVKQVTLACAYVSLINHRPIQSPLCYSGQFNAEGHTRGEDWQLDFTQMPLLSGYKYLLVFIDTFTGWDEAFSTLSEKATEVCKSLLKEIIPRLGLPKSLQSDNGPSFIARITQGLTMALGIDYKLHTSWHPQSPGKVEKMNHTLKKTLANLCQRLMNPGPTCFLLHFSGSV